MKGLVGAGIIYLFFRLTGNRRITADRDGLAILERNVRIIIQSTKSFGNLEQCIHTTEF